MTLNKKYVKHPDGTWNCIPSADHTTVHSESAMELISGFHLIYQGKLKHLITLTY